MTVLDRHPELKEPTPRVVLEPPKSPPQRPVRWIAWTFSIIVLAAAAIAALVLTSNTTESFDDIYEAGSSLSYGAIHEPGFTVAPRWVGESGVTLEEFETMAAYRATTGEADRVFERFVDPTATALFTPVELAALQASVGEADAMYMNTALFTPVELAALQASVGEADAKYMNMASTG